MDRQLLRSTFKKILHIALFSAIVFSFQKINAQSLLLPGDVVIVTVNAESNSIDFIPLIDIEENTSLYFADGVWNSDEQVLNGNEIELIFNTSISAGTNIHINEKDDERFSVSGKLAFTGKIHHLFAFQKEGEYHRFIYGVGWGEPGIWDLDNPEGSTIPGSLDKDDNTLLTLSNKENFQYYLRNGASGTRKMLLKFVGDAANWRGRDNSAYPTFGTSFNLLSPPVVLFDNSISTVEEDGEAATLNVAIYEHDGSRLTVDVVYDSLRSITNSDDIENFSSSTLNFTGLIGDGVYEVNVPIHDDNKYEGTETGIFTLQNLSKGDFGDFLTHSLIVNDNEQPEVHIAQIVNNSRRTSFIEIKNTANVQVSLRDWSIYNKEKKYFFDDELVLLSAESLRMYDNTAQEAKTYSGKAITTDLRKILTKRGGELSLLNKSGEVIIKKKFSKQKGDKGEKDEVIVSSRTDIQNEIHSVAEVISSKESTSKIITEGWKLLPNQADLPLHFSGIDFYTWSESSQEFLNIKDINPLELEEKIIIGYFETETIEKLSDWASDHKNKLKETSQLELKLSASDKNENEIIDRLEGMNLVQNNLNKPISVELLISELSKAQPGVEFNPSIYSISESKTGEITYIPMSLGDEIEPNAPFWISLDFPQEESLFSFDEGVLTTEESFEALSDESATKLGLTLSGGTFSETINLEFNSQEEISNLKNLNSYPELNFPSQKFVNLSFTQGEDYLSKLKLPVEFTNKLSLPVTFRTSESGSFTLQVSEWNEVPKEWEVLLEDKATGKQHNIRKDFTFDFNYESEAAEGEREINSQEENKYKDNDRFTLSINPPQQQQELNDASDLPTELELFQNFPNPFNPLTTISFFIPEPTEVTLSVFNIVGQPVSVVVNGNLSAGEHQFEWDAADRPSGMYIYQLEVGNKIMTRKMTLVK
ncbi:MAG: T9SS type A sorting domain-containing protein [Balneolaceae bacterium]